MMEPKTCYSTFLTLKLITFLLLNFTLRKLSAYENYYSRDDFPHDFIFGAATTAYQVEGAANEDGRTPSIWDTFAHDVFEGTENGNVACDGYHKGPVNPKGLEYYNNLINELISNGIQPHVTLHNFDLPQVLEDEYGGWVSRKIIRDFTNYADVCFREFGDRVLYWTTINEPNVFAIGGYDLGATPPRRCSPPFCHSTGNKGNSTIEPYLAVHNILLSHSSAARLYRRKYKENQHGFVGISIFTFGCHPITNTERDRVACQRVYDHMVGWIMEPLVRGDYPISMKRNAGSRIPAFTSRESKQIKGVIHYYNINVTDNPDALNNNLRDYNMDIAAVLYFELFSNEEIAVTPWKLVEELNKLKLLYGNPPLFIYENGQRTNSNSSLQDVTRVNYLYGYIGAVLDALRDGSNIKGYFVWSFMDVFELLDGYESSFGLYYVDRNDPELKRYPKLSAKWYNKFLKGGRTSIVGDLQQLNKDPSHCSLQNRGDSTTEPYLAVHHILLSRSSAVRLYRRKYKDKQHGFIGIAVCSSGLIPANDTDEDRAATQRARARIPTFSDRESAQLKGSCDFIGMIFYNNLNVTDNSVALKRNLRDYGADMAAQLTFAQALFSNEEYPVTPWTLREELNIMKTLYGNPPIFIYENGQRTQRNSSLQDVTRVEYLHGYIGAVLDSIRDGSNIKGYFGWSFMDVFELLDGYNASFGLYYVDRDDPKLKRYPKLSAEWYGNFLKGGKTSVVGAIELEKDPSSVSVGHLCHIH
ncbi:hypothetical protein Ahy_A02g005946 isoform A [Arachis hypogaea]|uniref:Beta-glucosidase n=1 Tax=Arachis hypogaea TaxID=3818 RepID=A0A445E850_ARAHY|nr:hypothetical protein Ahy_A02g005946 isoform A [Arachis hypogaea]